MSLKTSMNTGLKLDKSIINPFFRINSEHSINWFIECLLAKKLLIRNTSFKIYDWVVVEQIWEAGIAELKATGKYLCRFAE